MVVKQLTLKQFRNYESETIELTDGINIFYGDNAQGKTNLLEGICYCATGKSHRTSNDKECIRLGAEEALIRIVYEVRGKEEKIEIHLKKSGHKTILVNGYPSKRSELIGRFHVVVFSPEDLSLVKNGPQYRRKFMDMELSQVDAVYLHNLQQYYHVLRQRNQLLKVEKNPQTVADTIFAWDQQLVYYGLRIMEKRAAFVKKLESYTAQIHQSITNQKEQLTIRYDQGAPSDAEEYAGKLEAQLEKDLRFGTTGIGPQHDDMTLFLNGTEVRTFGSQGQQRTAALSMKLAEMQMMREELGDEPVLLLDDVMSELDVSRQKELASYIRKNQTILTCTGIEDSIRDLEAEGMFHVLKGQVEKESTEEIQ